MFLEKRFNFKTIYMKSMKQRSKDWSTPINKATLNCRLEVVKHLHETGHANVETKDNNWNCASRECDWLC